GEDDILIGGAAGDFLDGGDQDDLIFGGNATLLLNPGAGDAIKPRVRALTGATIYDANGLAQVGGGQGPPRPPPGGARRAMALDVVPGHSGGDYLAGGAHKDTIFGQQGDDTIQGDGSIDWQASLRDQSGAVTDPALGRVSAFRAGGALFIRPSFEAGSDGDD